MSKIEYIINKAIKSRLNEQDAPAPASKEFNNAKSDSGDIPFTPAEKKFLGKFDAYGSTHLGIIYSTTDIGIEEFIARSGSTLNVTPGILLSLLKRKIIKLVPYGGYGSNDNYTIELQLSLDDIKGWGAEDQAAAEKKNPSGAGSGGGGIDMGGGMPAPSPEPPTA